MAKLTKKQKEALSKIEKNKVYTLDEASALVKEVNTAKFDASVDIAVRLGVDPRKANQMVRGVVSLPHGTGKDVKVLALVTPDKEAEAKEAVMGKLGPLGRILGPRGLMPNPKSGTVTMDIGKAVSEVKSGKIDFKVDKYGIIHAGIGKVSFDAAQIKENAAELIQTLMKLKPTASKGIYVRSIYLSSTMSPGIAIDAKSVN